MESLNYSDNVNFVGLVEAATQVAHHHELGKRRRDAENAYVAASRDADALPEPKKTLTKSAAILFKEPSEKSKKYSRPPLGKVFTSLELEPDAFLKLQSAAKDYMLSEEFPERRNVVGHKKQSGNSDHAKLKLYECVEEFLRQNDNGEAFFGHSANLDNPDVAPRSFFWPEDHGRIIKLLMPLLRKMVTNERQRLYAAESRKGDPKKAANDSGLEEETFNGDLDIDPVLQTEYQVGRPIIPNALGPPPTPFPNTLNIYINVVNYENGDGRNLLPEFVLPADKVNSFTDFLNYLQYADLDGTTVPEVKALLPGGLVAVRDDTGWLSAKLTASQTVWMQRRLTIVVEC